MTYVHNLKPKMITFLLLLNSMLQRTCINMNTFFISKYHFWTLLLNFMLQRTYEYILLSLNITNISIPSNSNYQSSKIHSPSMKFYIWVISSYLYKINPPKPTPNLLRHLPLISKDTFEYFPYKIPKLSYFCR